MIRETKPDYVIVTTIDRTHHTYIIRAMELGCDVISEKPMTVDEEKCQEILDAVKRTGRNLRVTFNYRYAPHNTKIRELIRDGVIGEVYSVHFEWLLNTQHGADYFRRWHRDKRNSGGLLVHKSTHHFDLVNFWLGYTAEARIRPWRSVASTARENAEQQRRDGSSINARQAAIAKNDPFAVQLEENPHLKAMYLDAEDPKTVTAVTRAYSATASASRIRWACCVQIQEQGDHDLFLERLSALGGLSTSRSTAAKGRIEAKVVEQSYINSGGDKALEGAVVGTTINVFPMFGEPYNVPIEEAEGGHGGGDPIMLNDLFGVPQEDPLNRAASHIDGAMSILTGIAGNISIRTGMPVDIDGLVKF